MFAKYKKIIIIVLVLIVGFLVWSIFIKADPTQDALLINNGSQKVDKVGEEIINALNKMKNISLEKDVFSHPIFIRLEDYSKPIDIRGVGRSNPFEPFDPNAPIVTPDTATSTTATTPSASTATTNTTTTNTTSTNTNTTSSSAPSNGTTDTNTAPEPPDQDTLPGIPGF